MRLFVAVWPSSAVVAALARMPRPELAGVRWTTKDQWHVTLHFLGDLADPGPVIDALAAGLRDVPAATASLARRARRFGPSAVGVPVQGLDSLAGAVARAVAEAIPAPAPAVGESRRFTGHLTLARCRRRVPAAALAVGLPSLRWRVQEVVLVRSHLGPAGPRYETLSAFATRTRQRSD